MGGGVQAAATAAVIALAIPALAGPVAAKPARTRPQGPAAVRFAPDFPVLIDSEWGWRIGGFGGIRRGAPRRHLPVVFVHGNNVDAADWYPVRDDFRAAGWTDQELWGLSYGGLGGANGTALHRANPERDSEHQAEGDQNTGYITEDDVNVPDLYRFVLAVERYTGSRQVLLVGHSLGVTLARETMRLHADLRRSVAAFVGIAGANHGTSFCPPGSPGSVVSCDEIAAGTPWLARLNAFGETYRPTAWMTIYDGTGLGDPAFAGPTYAQSPALRGADNRQFPYTYHNDLRLDAPIVAVYRAFLERHGTLRPG
ncbi:MAG: triacylglycerol lipase [Mycobacteriales bacterium]